MKNTKFVVKVNGGSTRATEYVRRLDLTPIQMTANRKLALVMGRFTTEDAVKSLQNSRCSPEVVPVPFGSRCASPSAIKSKDQDRSKGAMEQDQQNHNGNTSMQGQLGHRDEDVELKDADSNLAG